MLFTGVYFACDQIDDHFLGAIGQQRIEKDAKGDPVLVAVVRSAVFCRKGLQFEELREFATGRQENTSDVE